MKTTIISISIIIAFAVNLFAQENMDSSLKIYYASEEKPVFPIESMTFYEYLDQHLDYDGDEKYFIVTFYVMKDGSIKNIEIKKNKDELFCKKVEEVIKKSSPWIPGKDREQNVNFGLNFGLLLPTFENLTYENAMKLGDKSFQEKDFASAITYYNRSYLIDKTEDIKNKLAETYIELGKEYLTKNDTTKACSYFRKSISKKSNNAKAKKYLRKYCN
jgi:tetratricopeptide (TPR) repeat protein